MTSTYKTTACNEIQAVFELSSATTMNSHKPQQQFVASPGRKPDNLNKDNLQPSSKTPNLTGSAGFIPQAPSGDATSSVKKYTAGEILQMMKTLA